MFSFLAHRKRARMHWVGGGNKALFVSQKREIISQAKANTIMGATKRMASIIFRFTFLELPFIFYKTLVP